MSPLLDREHLNEASKGVLSCARNQLFKDWVELYARCGIEDSEERMGNCVLLLASVLVGREVGKNDAS